MGLNPILDQMILNMHKENCAKIDQELVDFTNKVQEMIKNLQPENIEVLMNNGVMESLDDVQDYIDKYITNKGE